MGRNLTGTTISSTYEGLVQISGSILTDGTGSNIDYLTVTASYAANVTTPTLQSVTDTGNTTTNVISSSAGVVLHEPSALNPTAYLQIGGLEDLTAVYFTAERNGAYQFRLASNDSTNSIVLNQSGSQTVKLDFSNSAGEIEANGDITLDTTFASSGGKVVSLAPVSSSYGFTGSLQGNADTATSASHAVIADSALTATSASHAVNADSAVSSSYAVTASFAENATSDFPYTGSAIISGSLNVTGSVSIDTQDDTANALYIKGGRVVIDSQNGTDSVWVNIGNNNSFTSTDKSPVFSLGAGINNQSAAHGTAFGENHTINSFGYNTFIAGGNGNTITGNKSAIIAGTSNVVNGHNNSVVVGGTSLQTTKDDEVVTPNLTISGSGNLLTFADGTTQASAGVSFPYTGSAIISGSLEVTGSQSGLLADNQGINIFASASANTTNGNILIGAQIPTQNNYNTNIGKGNIVLGSGDFLTDAAGVLNGAGDFNIVLSGYSGGVNTGLYNTVIGGGNSFIGVSGSGITNTNTRFNTIIGGENQNIDDRATYNGIFAGRNNKMAAIGVNSNQYSVIVGGLGNHISSSDYSAIVGGNSHQMEFANYAGIFAGNNHTFVYGTNTSAYSALIGGANNNMAHVRSAVIGGSFLSSSADDQVVVPNLVVSGSISAYTGVAAIGVTGSFEYSGSNTYNGPVNGAVNVVTWAGAGTSTVDCSLGNFFTLTTNASATTMDFTNFKAGQTIQIRMALGTASPGTITWDTAIDWAGGTPIQPTGATSGYDVFTFVSFDGTSIQATAVQNLS